MSFIYVLSVLSIPVTGRPAINFLIGQNCTVQLQVQISNSNSGFINKYNVFTCLGSPACMQLAAMPMPYPAGHFVQYCALFFSHVSSLPLFCTVVVQLYCAATTPRLSSGLAQTEVVKQLLTISEDENCGDSHEF